MTCLSARDLSCRRNGRTLFSGLSFTLEGGAALALTGPNGVGKTSLLRMLAGLLEVSSGEVMFEAQAGPARTSDLTRAERGLFISGRDPLKNALSVRELLTGWRDILFADEGGDIADALDAFALTALADTPCAYLSSGQRRRVSLARLKLSTPVERPLWLLDEPTNALDAHARALLATACAAHRAAGGLVVAATHDPLGWPDLRTLDLGALDPTRHAGVADQSADAGA